MTVSTCHGCVSLRILILTSAATLLKVLFQSEALIYKVPPFFKVPRISHAPDDVDSEDSLPMLKGKAYPNRRRLIGAESVFVRA